MCGVKYPGWDTRELKEEKEACCYSSWFISTSPVCVAEMSNTFNTKSFVVVSFNPASCTAIYLSGPACEAGWEELATKRKGNINSLPLENLLEALFKALS